MAGVVARDAAAVVLRRVHRDVGALQQQTDVVAVIRSQRETEAGVDRQGQPVEVYLLNECTA